MGDVVNLPNPRADWKPSEYEMIVHQVRKDRERFIARLSKNIRQEGDCQVWVGHTDANGYARINFKVPGARNGGKPGKLSMKIGVHRLFLILKLCRPIKPYHEAGHLIECCNPLCVKHIEEQSRADNIQAIRR